MAIWTFSALPVLTTAAATLVCYLSWTVIYRLYISPISKFPGPRLAALTFWFVTLSPFQSVMLFLYTPSSSVPENICLFYSPFVYLDTRRH